MARTRMRASSSRMTVMQRSRRSWTSWRLSRMSRRRTRARQRRLLLQAELQYQLLREKELQLEQESLLHRLAELQDPLPLQEEQPRSVAPRNPEQIRDLLGYPKS